MIKGSKLATRETEPGNGARCGVPRARYLRSELWAGAVGEDTPVGIGRQMSTWCGDLRPESGSL